MLGNSITITDQEQLEAFFINAQQSFNKNKRLEFKIEAGKRSKKQDSSMHVYCRQVAQCLNDMGITCNKFFNEGYEMKFSEDIIKRDIWKVVQLAMTGKESTKDLDKKEVSEVYEVVNKKLSEHGAHIAWPSNDSMMNAQRK
jgi:hypothetical protein